LDAVGSFPQKPMPALVQASRVKADAEAGVAAE
jgi:hypothetical protein